MNSFESYEYAGYIIPGAILLLGLMSLIWTTDGIKGKFGLSEIGIFLIVVFVLGHLLHAIGHFVDQRPPWSCEGGTYGQNLIVFGPDQDLLSAREFEALANKIKDKFYVDMTTLKATDPADVLTWCNVVMRIAGEVTTAKRSALADTLMRDYGLYLGLAGSFILLLVLLPLALLLRLRPDWLVRKGDRDHSSIRWARVVSVLSILLLASSISLLRLIYFGRSYARELFLEFLAT